MRKFIVTLVLAGFIALALNAPLYAQEDPIAVLKDKNSSYLQRSEACRALALTGTAEAVPALEAQLTDPRFSHIARLALEAMPAPEADAALRNAMGKTTGRLQAGMISSLSLRGNIEAVPAFIALLSSEEAVVAHEAARGLGRIASPEAIQALTDALAQPNLEAKEIRAITDGLFKAAEKIAAKGQAEKAIEIYDGMREAAYAPSQVRAAALRGAILTREVDQGLPLLIEALHNDEEDLFSVSLRTAREWKDNAAITTALTAALPVLPEARKARLMDVLAHRGDADAGPALLTEAKAGVSETRVAAIRALTRLAYSEALPAIAELAVTDDKQIAKAAKDSLSYFPGGKGDAMILALLEANDLPSRLLAVELIGQGALDNPEVLLMQVVKSDSEETARIAALKSLKEYAGQDEMPGLLKHLLATPSGAEMKATESAIAALCARQKKMPAGSVVINEAKYGNLAGGKFADVTKKAAEMVSSGKMSIDASNANFGDPASGQVKQLYVAYTVDGTSYNKTVGENQSLRLTKASIPVALVDALCTTLDAAQGEAKLAVLRLLGYTGNPKALKVVQTIARDATGAEQETALDALCDWPTTDALPAIFALATFTTDSEQKDQALRGTVRLLKQSDMASTDKVENYAALTRLATSTDMKTAVLGGLSQVHHVDALALVLCKFNDDAVKAEKIQAATAIAKNLGKGAKEDKNFFNGTDLSGWQGNMQYWKLQDGAITGGGDMEIPQNEFLWSPVKVADFYLSLDVKLNPDTANAGIQFRSIKVDDATGQAMGYQADMGKGWWGKLYHEHGLGMLDDSEGAAKAVKTGEWNSYEILAVGPAIWTAINGKLGVAYVDAESQAERAGLIAVQIHSGAPQTVQYRINKLVHNPEVSLVGIPTEELIKALR